MVRGTLRFWTVAPKTPVCAGEVCVSNTPCNFRIRFWKLVAWLLSRSGEAPTLIERKRATGGAQVSIEMTFFHEGVP